MDEDITIINANARNEKIKNFLNNNKKFIIALTTILVLTVLGIYSYKLISDKQKKNFSDKYNNAIIQFKKGDKSKTIDSMKEVIGYRDSTYSPLALYFLIDNNLIKNKEDINNLFDILINKTSLEKEIKNLVIYKKALYNADTSTENELLNMLNPVINSKSVWKSHALYLLAEFFYSKDEKEKSKEFFIEIINLENSNQELKLKSQKRLNRDLSD